MEEERNAPSLADLPPNIIAARAAASMVLYSAAGSVSDILTVFGTWFLGAVGAGLALLLSNWRAFDAGSSPAVVTAPVYPFLIAGACCLLQRYLSAVVTGAVRAAEKASCANNFDIGDIPEFFRQVSISLPRIIRWYPNKVFSKVLEGDLAAPARGMIYLTLAQGFLLAIQIIFLGVTILRGVRWLSAIG